MASKYKTPEKDNPLMTRRECEVFVSNACFRTFQECMQAVHAVLRNWHESYVTNGCLVPEGLDRLNAAIEVKRAELAAEAEQAARDALAGNAADVPAPTIALVS